MLTSKVKLLFNLIMHHTYIYNHTHKSYTSINVYTYKTWHIDTYLTPSIWLHWEQIKYAHLFWFPYEGVMVWMENVPQRLMYLNTWLLFGEVIAPVAGGSVALGGLWRAHIVTPLLVLSLLPACGRSDVSFSYPRCHAWSLPTCLPCHYELIPLEL